MAGRPRKPIGLKAQQGDTRKVGARRHEEEVEKAFNVTPGRPEMPGSLKEVRLGPKATDEQLAAEIRREYARRYWDDHCQQLERIGLLKLCDAGILEGMAMNRALRREAFDAGDVKAFDALDRTFMQQTNLTGLNESARAKIPKPTSPQMSAEEMALSADLPGEQPTVQ